MKNNYNLTIKEYFNLIQQKIRDKDFKIQKFTSEPDKNISVYLESVNYMMWKYADDHKDKRHIFPYIIIPNDVDWDFTSISLKEFMSFLANNKSTEIEMIDIDIKKEEKNEKLDSFWD